MIITSVSGHTRNRSYFRLGEHYMKRWIFMAFLIGMLIGCQSNEMIDTKTNGAELSSLRTIAGKADVDESVETLVRAEPLELTVILKEYYRDGVIETSKKEETIWSMLDFWNQYQGWTVESQDLETIVFQRQVNDISPLTEQQGYFGLTKDGELAVFQGDPDEGKVIESFKPVPVKPLESKRETKLENGIKIKDYQHFEQVLHQYSQEIEL